MIVISMQNVNETLRGELTRYLLEIKAGVFIGNTNSRVTELLWKKVEESIETGGAILARSDNSEQGFSMKMTGSTTRVLEDFDGLTLITYKK